MFQRRSQDHTVLGPGAVIEGDIKSAGSVHLDGRVEGRIDAAGQISIGPSGKVRGEVSGDDIVLAGEVDGALRAKGHLHILASGRLRGEVTYGSIAVDRGGSLDGQATRIESAEDTETEKSEAGLHEKNGARVVASVKA